LTQEHVYDGLFILNSEAYARNPEEVSGQIAKTIESLGGVVRVSRLWEERKLAYPIKNHRRGTYWLTYFRMQTDKLVELNRQFQLNGNVIRFLIQTIDPRLEDALVEHALAGPAQREDATEEAAAPAADVYEEETAEDEE
jgi:small subunit ribosomal protein S6